jgi:hypothetical protein
VHFQPPIWKFGVCGSSLRKLPLRKLPHEEKFASRGKK